MSDVTSTAVASLPPVDEKDLDIASAWARDALWAAVADLFHRYQEEEGLSYADVARRIGRTRSQVHRWLTAPMNMTLCSAGLLAEGLDADLRIELAPRTLVAHSNQVCPADVAHAMATATRSLSFRPPVVASNPPMRSNMVAPAVAAMHWTTDKAHVDAA